MKELLASPAAGSGNAHTIFPLASETPASPQGSRSFSDHAGHAHRPQPLSLSTSQVPLTPGDSEYASSPPPFGARPQDEATKDIISPSGPSVDKAQSTAKTPNSLLAGLAFTIKAIMVSSYVNVLLIFVPVGIALGTARHSGVAIRPTLIFCLNSVAIIPLANLLSFATETMAARRGPAVGALMNVTFGNAVELIIFVIALVKDEIRIVQASLLGSILANLLLILGMCFLLGGLRFREQVYNPTVTQTMACLLSLSVISLVLPTAFHASFQDHTLAKKQDLKISRMTSIVLLVVYVLYLVFQLKTHAYLYRSLPQAMIDREAQPGPVAAFLHESHDRDSGDWASDHSWINRTESVHSRKAKSRRVLMRLVGCKRKRSTASSTGFIPAAARTPTLDSPLSTAFTVVPSPSGPWPASVAAAKQEPSTPVQRRSFSKFDLGGEGRFRTVSASKPKPRLRDSLGRSLAPGLFLDQQAANTRLSVDCPRSPVRVGVRRPVSLPGRLSQTYCSMCEKLHPSACPPPAAGVAACRGHVRAGSDNATLAGSSVDVGHHMSTRAAVVLLLVSTALVAYCAELMVGAISDMLAMPTSPVGEAFIGLIVLPIVGNAAEHVTAITVALKNKLDLAIAVSIGSSIQIALFVTPFVVILGWTLDRGMTLRFTLFETVCLFLAAFIVNFLVLDGRSNYLEGALLLAAYIIIAVVAFYYPAAADSAAAAGGDH
ncbi:calcium/proton exchanger [Magnaporthiopsis poae ATCC 64411]|uniref:Calcium/proton exchanger n=1 Tax=Magnaporthiopsis poae (strain ATCC 64411 / 73-15) TaxID=644358 RepID=A0A0C4DL04_MAGP6|nr:calcium/proton exchanger [Magnaporthiopsis poae ATCC 64411]